jgi:hypothetical protein
VFGKEGLRKVNQIGYDLVVSICPERGKFKAVAGLFGPPSSGLVHLFHVAGAGSVGIILGMRPVGDHENLYFPASIFSPKITTLDSENFCQFNIVLTLDLW